MSDIPNIPDSATSPTTREMHTAEEQEEVVKMIKEHEEELSRIMESLCKRVEEEVATLSTPGSPKTRDMHTEKEREEAWDSLLKREKAKAEKAELDMLWYHDWIKELEACTTDEEREKMLKKVEWEDKEDAKWKKEKEDGYYEWRAAEEAKQRAAKVAEMKEDFAAWEARAREQHERVMKAAKEQEERFRMRRVAEEAECD